MKYIIEGSSTHLYTDSILAVSAQLHLATRGHCKISTSNIVYFLNLIGYRNESFFYLQCHISISIFDIYYKVQMIPSFLETISICK